MANREKKNSRQMAFRDDWEDKNAKRQEKPKDHKRKQREQERNRWA